VAGGGIDEAKGGGGDREETDTGGQEAGVDQ